MTHVKCEDYVVLLGIDIDHMLTFNDHITDICKKSARQLAALKRLGQLLTLHWKVAIFKSFNSKLVTYTGKASLPPKSAERKDFAVNLYLS